jgi:hypothetical protein
MDAASGGARVFETGARSVRVSGDRGPAASFVAHGRIDSAALTGGVSPLGAPLWLPSTPLLAPCRPERLDTSSPRPWGPSVVPHGGRRWSGRYAFVPRACDCPSPPRGRGCWRIPDRLVLSVRGLSSLIASKSSTPKPLLPYPGALARAQSSLRSHLRPRRMSLGVPAGHDSTAIGRMQAPDRGIPLVISVRGQGRISDGHSFGIAGGRAMTPGPRLWSEG